MEDVIEGERGWSDVEEWSNIGVEDLVEKC